MFTDPSLTDPSLTAQQKQAICDAVASGATLACAGQQTGCTVETILRVVAADLAFRNRLQDATLRRASPPAADTFPPHPAQPDSPQPDSLPPHTEPPDFPQPDSTEPGLLSAAQQLEFASALKSGASAETASRYTGCTLDEARAAAAQDPNFAARVRCAASVAEVRCLKTISTTAESGKDWRAAAWLLERLFPDRYGKGCGKCRKQDQSQQNLATFLQDYAEAISAGLSDSVRSAIAENTRHFTGEHLAQLYRHAHRDRSYDSAPDGFPLPEPDLDDTLYDPTELADLQPAADPTSELESRLQPVPAPASAAPLESRLQPVPAPLPTSAASCPHPPCVDEAQDGELDRARPELSCPHPPCADGTTDQSLAQAAHPTSAAPLESRLQPVPALRRSPSEPPAVCNVATEFRIDPPHERNTNRIPPDIPPQLAIAPSTGPPLRAPPRS